MPNIVEQLLDMKELIKETELKKAKSEGRQSQLMNDLKRMGFDTVEKAEKRMKAIDRKIEKLEKDLEDGLTELEEKYEW